MWQLEPDQVTMNIVSQNRWNKRDYHAIVTMCISNYTNLIKELLTSLQLEPAEVTVRNSVFQNILSEVFTDLKERLSGNSSGVDIRL